MLLICPSCATPLPAISNESLDCSACEAVWPVIAGIPDLRTAPDPYIEIAEDREKASMLAARAADLAPAELIDLYFSVTPEVPPDLARGYRRGMLQIGPARAEDRVSRLEGESSLWARAPRVLDLGCGAGAWLPALAARSGEVVGVDVALRWLIVAQCVARHYGIEPQLVCANAETIPLANCSVDVVVASNVLEHAREPQTALDEMFRVLDKDGVAYVATPNRYSLLPEPHVGLPGLGLLPRSAADELVRRTRGVPYGGITLRGAMEWVDLVTAAGFRRVEVRPPGVGPQERAVLSPPRRAAARLLGLIRRAPGGETALKLAGPMLEVQAFKGPNRERVGVGRSRI